MSRDPYGGAGQAGVAFVAGIGPAAACTDPRQVLYWSGTACDVALALSHDTWRFE